MAVALFDDPGVLFDDPDVSFDGERAEVPPAEAEAGAGGGRKRGGRLGPMMLLAGLREDDDRDRSDEAATAQTFRELAHLARPLNLPAVDVGGCRRLFAEHSRRESERQRHAARQSKIRRGNRDALLVLGFGAELCQSSPTN